MKEFLSRAGVKFTAKNVDEDDNAYDELVSRGFRTIPVTVSGERVIKGFDVASLNELVETAKGEQASGPAQP